MRTGDSYDGITRYDIHPSIGVWGYVPKPGADPTSIRFESEGVAGHLVPAPESRDSVVRFSGSLSEFLALFELQEAYVATITSNTG
jgi:hypothetical protein